MTTRRTLTESEVDFIQAQRVAALSTSDAGGRPYSVPICFAFDGERFYTPLDEKPKAVDARSLRRVRNIEARHDATLLFNQYDDDWSRLGHLQVYGRAELLEPGTPGHAAALPLLRGRYPQYHAMRLEDQPVIAVTPASISSWGSAVSEASDAGARSQWLQPGRGLDFLPLARGRRSVRAFEDRPVPREALETLLEAARWAPSPHGRQPWRFVVLTRPELKAQLAEAMGSEWQRTLEMDQQTSDIIQLRLEKSHERIRTAPALVLACLYLADLDRYPDPGRQQAEEIMAIQSLGAALQNILLAAYAIGLDSGWMCAPLFCPDTVRAALDLDETLIPHALIPIGYAARDPKRRPHRPIDELIVRFD
ncbi:MAG: TIGR03668 family PPOX class F420-dependent oxidoreductase [Ktedonobacterales bacterium]